MFAVFRVRDFKCCIEFGFEFGVRGQNLVLGLMSFILFLFAGAVNVLLSIGIGGQSLTSLVILTSNFRALTRLFCHES